ncbi:pyridoxamine 5'-phosphate oxidase family protein [Streptacidiphilus sp. N1-12]|uniref:Pyridoxamine 5'-phosphate oxidase family protein n=2 Tax=Streptacidiphilus alkalitolerans TaxID=3342712 RepID=A0ABV6WI23_9ACTN
MDPNHLTADTLTPDACLRLLGRTTIGRVVYTRHALPVVLPVRFRLDYSGAVVLAAPPGTQLAERVDGSIVAFQAEELDPATLRGHSVMLHGRAEALDDGEELRLVPQMLCGTVLVGA